MCAVARKTEALTTRSFWVTNASDANKIAHSTSSTTSHAVPWLLQLRRVLRRVLDLVGLAGVVCILVEVRNALQGGHALRAVLRHDVQVLRWLFVRGIIKADCEGVSRVLGGERLQ